ncbi:reticulon-like protein B9 [Cynara cardunculus var. scolymus]|uniref:reticulon-like protein B9 n=1 Tax=Cynara cardunculus var. scolymus TaxID=59895 RepID=UPI000D623137|nr:reticulon-like protein B9 [Cynara cardunculus var. scolymus]
MSKLTQNVDYSIPQITRLYGRKRPIHKILGGGEVADILLWRNKIISGVTSIVVLTIWFLFEFAEYNLVTFLCHLTITVMLIIFIWTNGAKAFGWTPPNVPKILLEESTIYQGFCANLNFLISRLVYIACGNDIKLFCLAILTISILSMIGSYVTALNLLFIGFCVMGTLPYLYEKHEEKVDYLFHKLNQKVFKIYKMFDRYVVSKIPRWPMRSKKSN